jgi:hypothetical protein
MKSEMIDNKLILIGVSRGDSMVKSVPIRSGLKNKRVRNK